MTCLKAIALSTAIMLVMGGLSPTQAQTHKPLFAERWNNGVSATEPQMQVQRVDANTFVIRQSLRTNFEGPFLYLFFGKDKVMLLDTGAGGLKIRPTIDGLIAKWLEENGRKSIPLVVAHTHGHGDHIAGDPEFAGDPNITVVGHSPEEVAAFFNIKSWPTDVVPFELGGRTLYVIPSPGHEAAELTIYDPETKFLQMGDGLYPGRLYVTGPNFETYRQSIDRVVAFTRTHPVSWIMGNHIEMTTTPGIDIPIGVPTHPHEHRLELPYSDLLQLQAALHKMRAAQISIHKDYMFYMVPR
jgi:glyoxylase-like metal-dependent hydrolase (beta-lactamase superfamily II)